MKPQQPQQQQQQQSLQKISQHYDHYLFSHGVHTKINTINKIEKSGKKNDDYKKYRKRIFSLVKDIMKNKTRDTHITEAFNHFIDHAIEYLKFKDLEAATQKELEQLNENNTVPVSKPTIDMKIYPIDEEYDTNDTKQMTLTMNKYGINKLEDSNKLIFKKHTPNSMRIEDCLPIQFIQNGDANKAQSTFHNFLPKQKQL